MSAAYVCRAAFMMPGTGVWAWRTWRTSESSAHAAVHAKAAELGAVAWDWGNADHAHVSEARESTFGPIPEVSP